MYLPRRYFALFLVTIWAVPVHAAVWYVDIDNAAQEQDGTSWATAFNRIQEGIDAAFDDDGGEVWVAEGTYDHASEFEGGEIQLLPNVDLYGGFDGTETVRDERDWVEHLTTIDGSAARGGEKASSVIVANEQAEVLDGFMVTGGHAMGELEDGGGLFLQLPGSFTVANCTFVGNQADRRGGAIYTLGDQLIVENCTFSDNSALGEGGAIYANSNDFEISDSFFIGNSASNGGGVWADPLTIRNCTFSNNSAEREGGASWSDRATVSDSSFLGNSADEGGAVYTDSATIDLCTFEDNVATLGGAISADKSSRDLILRESTFRSNEAAKQGGALWMDATTTIEYCVFEENHAGVQGGAIRKENGSPFQINASRFINNSSDFIGGAIWAVERLSVANSEFVANSASDTGGAFHIVGNNQLSQIANTTLFGNTALEASSIYFESDSIEDEAVIVNSIFWDDPDPLVAIGFGGFDISYSIIRGGFEGIEVQDSDPLFVSEELGDLQLTVDSPAIDSGTLEGAPETDILGAARPQGLGVDMGAYEMTPFDTDGDSLADVFEGEDDPDNDGIPNYLDLDSDDDGIDDSIEGLDDLDGDGLGNFVDTDSDGNGLSDSVETAGDFDSDGEPDYLDLDNDGDGISDEVEGIVDTDDDGTLNLYDLDSDGDGIDDVVETAGDLDGDGTPNFLDTDADGNGIPDSAEGSVDTDSDGVSDYADLDNDGDGIADTVEGLGDADDDGTLNLYDLDSDGDGILDAVEGGGDLDGDEIANFLDLDSDGDGVLDEVENLNGWNPQNADTDGDGIDDGVEVSNGWDPGSTDSDGDGMGDAYEFANGLDPGLNDRDGDLDGDGLSNFEEFDLGTDPQDGDNPGSLFFVATDGSDALGAGTSVAPWQSVQRAMTAVRSYATLDHAVSVYLSAGTYNGLVAFVPNVTLFGAGADSTTLEHFNANDAEHFVVIAAENTRLTDLEVDVSVLSAEPIVLVDVDNVLFEMEGVTLDGGFNPNSIGVLVEGEGSSSGSIRDSVIKNMNDGIWALDTEVEISGNTFQDIFRFALFVLPPDTRSDSTARTPSVGDANAIDLTGLNRFRNIGDRFIWNSDAGSIQAQFNDWGVYDDASIGAKFTGDVQFEPYISSEIFDGSLIIRLLDIDTGEEVPDSAAPSVLVDENGAAAFRDATSGLFIVDAVGAGVWTARATAAGYTEATVEITIIAEELGTATILMAGDGTAPASSGGGGGGGGCFIATAAYGTPMAEEIDVLRAVRDAYLLPNAPGAAFADTYYRLSPAIADRISESAALSALVRLVLLPMIWIVETASKVFFGICLVTIIVALLRKKQAFVLRGRP